MRELKKIKGRIKDETSEYRGELAPAEHMMPKSNCFLPANRCTQKNNIYPLRTSAELQYDSLSQEVRGIPYREAVCELCEKTVSLALGVPLAGMQARTRCIAEIALARQIAMYLCHTTFSVLLTEVGLHFNRDRSTVAHACTVVEDKRDDLAFDVMVSQLESLLNDAREAMGICFEHGCYRDSPAASGSSTGLLHGNGVTLREAQ